MPHEEAGHMTAFEPSLYFRSPSLNSAGRPHMGQRSRCRASKAGHMSAIDPLVSSPEQTGFYGSDIDLKGSRRGGTYRIGTARRGRLVLWLRHLRRRGSAQPLLGLRQLASGRCSLAAGSRFVGNGAGLRGTSDKEPLSVATRSPPAAIPFQGDCQTRPVGG
jgi:hypothetical protein